MNRSQLIAFIREYGLHLHDIFGDEKWKVIFSARTSLCDSDRCLKIPPPSDECPVKILDGTCRS